MVGVLIYLPMKIILPIGFAWYAGRDFGFSETTSIIIGVFLTLANMVFQENESRNRAMEIIHKMAGNPDDYKHKIL